MNVIADATPLISLAKIGQFHLLQKLFAALIITPEVYAEVVVGGAGLPGAQETSEACQESWMEVRPITRPTDFSAAQARFRLDIGELSTLVLAKESQADLVLLDDLEARKMAQREGLRVQGTVGILEACWERGYVTDLAGDYQNLLVEGIHLDRAFLNRRLQKLGLRPLG